MLPLDFFHNEEFLAPNFVPSKANISTKRKFSKKLKLRRRA